LTISTATMDLIKALRPVNDWADPVEVLHRAHLSVTSDPDDAAVAKLIAEHGIVDAFPAETVEQIEASATIAAMQLAVRSGVTMLIPGDAIYPAGLSDLEAPPVMLWMRGNDSAVAALSNFVSLGGSRAATGYGEHLTMEMSAGLVEQGFTVVSGAGYGVNGMAHRAAIAGGGITVAFLAGGLDRFYPAGHDSLLHRIVEVGAVLSEVPCGMQPTKQRFIQRNRIIAAVTQVTVVTEAGFRSGSLNTAEVAAGLGRAVGAVPGPVTSAASAGCHKLIAEGIAKLVCNSHEVAMLHPNSTE